MEKKQLTFLNSSLEKEFKDFLLNDKKLKRNYHFIALNFNKTKIEVLKISEAICDILDNSAVCLLDNIILIFMYDNLEPCLGDFIKMLEYDLGIKLGAFQSGRLSYQNSDNFFEYYYLYQMYLKDKTKVSYLPDLVFDIVSTNPKEVEKSRNIFLNKVNDESYKKLIITLLKNNLNVTKTAIDSYMHRNTINNKLEIIKEETGLNLQSFFDAMAMYVLIK